MEKLMVNGGKKLQGEITLHGAKNSVLPILCATVLVNGICVIHNCPDLSDVRVTINILRYLGAKVKREGGTVTVDTSTIFRTNILEEYMSELRSSIIFLGALASRMGEACLYLPGGCDIGLRPIDLHLKGLKTLGYCVYSKNNDVCAVKENVKGAQIVLPFPSVGATENILLASVLSNGTTNIVNAACEPEITDLIDFLNSAGAQISGKNTNNLVINGVGTLHSVEHTVIPDRILASTIMSAVSACKGDVLIKSVNINDVMPTFPVFEEMGCDLIKYSDSIRIRADKRPQRVRFIETRAFPGFPTDCQAPVAAALTIADGTSVIKENIFENRFKYTEQLKMFGADITVNERIAMINGVDKLHCADVRCTDLRGGASVVISALCAQGTSSVRQIQHIDRGYERIEKIFSSLGADIKRINDEKE